MAVGFTVERSTRASKVVAVLTLEVVIGLAFAPVWAERVTLRLLIQMFYYLALAQMWSLLAGYAGLVSVGQQAFVGLGGYLFFALALFGQMHPLVALALAGLMTVVVAVPTALVAFRFRGAYFAIGTWVIAEVYRLAFAEVSALGGGSGMSIPAPIVMAISDDRSLREFLVYWIALGLAVGAVLLVYFLLRSRWGLAMTAIRDSEPAAESVGVEVFLTKLFVYLLAAGMTGLAGALIFLQKLRISPDAAFSVNDWTAFVIFIVVIGGIGTIEGPIVGVAIFFLLREAASDWGSWYLILLGAIAVGVMLTAPRGIWGLIVDRYELHLFPVGRRLKH